MTDKIPSSQLKDDYYKKIQLIAEKLISLSDEEAPAIDDSLSEGQLAEIGFFARDFGMKEWDWPQGVGLYGLKKAASSLKGDVDDFIESWFYEQLELGLPLRNINTVTPLLALHDYEFAETISVEWAQWLYEEAERTEEKGLQHVTSGETKGELNLHPGEIWIDTLFMTGIFLVKMGKKHRRKEWVEEGIYQTFLHVKYLHDRKTNLFFHGWTFEERHNFGEVRWCRGNSWMTLALPMILKNAEEYLSTSEKRFLTETYVKQVEGLFNVLDRQYYQWHTVLTNQESYCETSGTAGILAGIFLGIDYGLLDKETYLPDCLNVLQSVLDQISESGEVKGVSAGTPVALTEDAYHHIIQASMAYGQSMVLLMLAYAKKYIEN